MRRITFLFGFLLIAATIVSCDKKIIEERLDPEPSAGNVTPVYNPDYVNMSCEDLTGGPYVAEGSGRVNYNSETDEFDNNGAWPYGLVVTVTEGKYVEFHFPKGAQTQYCVGAVIVKGGDGANVYYYDPGVRSDAGLVSPVNASGNPADLSTLTFCFVECELYPDLIIAFKGYLNDNGWAVTSTTEIPFAGYYAFVPNYTGNKVFYQMNMLQPVGNIIIEDIDEDGLLEVTVDTDDWSSELLFINNAYLFVGNLEDYNDLRNDYPDTYPKEFNYQLTNINTPTVTFNLPF